jgi:hypothetical protein
MEEAGFNTKVGLDSFHVPLGKLRATGHNICRKTIELADAAYHNH